MIKAIIVDDVRASRESLNLLLKKYCLDVHIVGMASNIEEAKFLVENNDFDLLFLDIELSSTSSGFDLLEQTKKSDFSIVFITAHDNYAIKAIKFNAVDYLLKPVSIEELKMAVQKVRDNRETLSNSDLKHLVEIVKGSLIGENTIPIHSKSGIDILQLNHLIRLEADGRYTTCYTLGGNKIYSTKNLKEYEQLLNSDQFIRIHHSHVINLKHVVRYHKKDGGFVVLTNGDQVAISQRKKESFLEALTAFNSK